MQINDEANNAIRELVRRRMEIKRMADAGEIPLDPVDAMEVKHEIDKQAADNYSSQKVANAQNLAAHIIQQHPEISDQMKQDLPYHLMGAMDNIVAGEKAPSIADKVENVLVPNRDEMIKKLTESLQNPEVYGAINGVLPKQVIPASTPEQKLLESTVGRERTDNVKKELPQVNLTVQPSSKDDGITDLEQSLRDKIDSLLKK